MAEPLRVGVIGRTGKGNYGHGIDTVWAEVPDTVVVGLADEHEAGRAAAAARIKAPKSYPTMRALLEAERPKLVGIGPRWIDQHAELALLAAEFDCHVYMEKPFVRTPAEADAVIQAFERKHLKLALAHQTRYSPVTAVVRNLVKAGAIGELLELRGRGKEDQRGGGEDLWVLGSHILDLMRYFAGDPESCTATVYSGGKPITPDDVKPGNEGLGPLAGDALHARYAFANGVIGDIASVRGKGGNPSRFGLQLYGSKGVIEILTGYLEPAWILQDAGWSPGRSNAKWVPITSQGIGKEETLTGRGLHGGNVAAVHDLLAAIKDDRQPLCSMYDGRGSIEMILGVYASHKAGGPVKLPLVQRTHPLA
jgi:predicted dehydrogenase